MELRQLRYFARTAELMSFSEAAKALNISQSTLSQQVRQLEDELHIRLFDRHAHSITLTEAGEEMLPFALRTLHEAESCVAKIQDINDLKTGVLNIGVTYSFSPILTETLISFTLKYPNVKLNVMYEPMSDLMELLLNHKVDFVLAFKPLERNHEIESHVLFDNHLAVIVRDGHPLAERTSLTLQDLESFSLALPARGLQARNAFDANIGEGMQDRLDVRIELNEVNILLDLIRNSNMVTVLAEATVYNKLGVRAIPLNLPVADLEGCVHTLRGCYRKHSAIEFIRMLSDSDAVRARSHEWLTRE